MREAIRLHTEATGERPLGWYTGRSSEHTLEARARRWRLSLLVGFLCRRSALLGQRAPQAPHLIIPYTLDANDMRFINPQGFTNSEDFFIYLRDSFDVLYGEGETRAEDDVGRAALPACRPPRPRRGPRCAFWIISPASTGSGSPRGSTLRATGIASIAILLRPPTPSPERSLRRRMTRSRSTTLNAADRQTFLAASAR